MRGTIGRKQSSFFFVRVHDFNLVARCDLYHDEHLGTLTRLIKPGAGKRMFEKSSVVSLLGEHPQEQDHIYRKHSNTRHVYPFSCG